MRVQLLVLLGSRAVAALFQAATFLVLSRAVSVADFGSVGVLSSACGFVLLVSDLGITSLVSRARARDERAIVEGALRVNDVMGVLVGAGCAAVAFVLPGVAASLVVLAASLAIERNSETQLSVFYADGDWVIPATSIVGRRLFALSAFLLLLWLSLDALLAFSIGQICGSMFSQLLQRESLRRRRVRSDRARFGVVVRSAWPFWVGAVAGQVRLLDTTLVAAVSSVYDAGLYSAAQRITNPLQLIPASISQVVLPHATSPSVTVRRLSVRVSLLFLASYLVIVPVCFSADRLMVLLLGAPYSKAGPFLVWALIAFPLLGVTGPLSAILQARGFERFVAANSTAFAAYSSLAMTVGGVVWGGLGVAGGLAVAAGIRAPVLMGKCLRIGHIASDSGDWAAPLH